MSILERKYLLYLKTETNFACCSALFLFLFLLCIWILAYGEQGRKLTFTRDLPTRSNRHFIYTQQLIGGPFYQVGIISLTS